MLLTIVHLAAIANFAYALYFDIFLVQLPPTAPRFQFGGQWKYLTFWNLWVQFAYFLISFINGLIGTEAQEKSKSSKLQRIRDFYFSTVAFPIGVFVATMFWTLYLIDRDLVFPVSYDKYFPVYVNHMLHTTVLPLQLLELVMSYHIYPSRVSGFLTTAAFCCLYLVWILVIAYAADLWVYPVLAVLSPVQRGLFMFGCACLGGLLYLAGEFANNVIWSKKVDSTQKTSEQPKKAAKSRKMRLD